jgi:DNA-binding transcriptional regulator YiaG
MINLKHAVKQVQWNRQMKETEFARELGITTLQYNRWLEDKPVPEEVTVSVLRWLMADPDRSGKQILQSELELSDKSAV